MGHRPGALAPRRALFATALAALTACAARDPIAPGRFTLVVAAAAPAAVRFAADDLARYLGRMGVTVARSSALGASRCIEGEGVVAFLGEGVESAHGLDVPGAAVGGPAESAPDGGLVAIPGTTPGSSLRVELGDATDSSSRAAQRWRIVETRCGDGFLGRHVALWGGGLMGRQYAAYDLLHQLGARFFHPEAELVPSSARWPAEPLRRDVVPAFSSRSVSLHLTHPLELGDPLELRRDEYVEEVRRYIDWEVKSFATSGLGGAGHSTSAIDPRGDLVEYGFQRGFPRSSGLNLHEVQQGGRPVVDPDSPLSPQEQIADAIEARMGVDPAVRPREFGFTFNPSEFTEIPDTQAVDEMTFIADYMAQHYPETTITTIDHGTAGRPTAHYGVRFYDLPKLAPPNLGVYVHSLMFYDLFRPAPVYGNTSFRFLYDFMVSEYRSRKLWHFPEAAWWLTFDIAVPLYLPITLDARRRDLEGIAFMLEGKLVGHHVFGTGHEWGYWQNEYCSLRMGVDLRYGWRECVADIAAPMGDAAPVVEAAVARVIELQERDIVYGDLLPYLVGTDPETEVAAQVGVVFHPLPPSPADVLHWELPAILDWERRIGAALARMEADYDAITSALAAVRARVPAAARPFFDEIADGIEVTGLRARHGRLVYGALVSARRARLSADPAFDAEARARLGSAKEATSAALGVIARREAGYRYQPLTRAIAGGPLGTEDRNWTVYKYRYLNRTHHGFYYTRIDGLVEAALTATSRDELRVADAILGAGESVSATAAAGLEGGTLDFGDGSGAMAIGAGATLTHDYAGPGIYELRLRGTRSGAALDVSARVAKVRAQLSPSVDGHVEQPSGAALIERILPVPVAGRVSDTIAALGFATDAGRAVAADRWVQLAVARPAAADIETSPARLVVPIVNRSTGAVLTSIVVDNAVLTAQADGNALAIGGDLSTAAVIDAVVAIGGFDAQGARALVASTLGYTPDTLPASVQFLARWTPTR